MDTSVIWTMWLFIQATSGLRVDPLVYWSMDSHKEMTLMPDHGNTQDYAVDLSTFRNEKPFQRGVIGESLVVKARKIPLIKDIWRSDCVRNPSKCSDGITLSFWLKVTKRGTTSDVIMRSSDERKTRPGIFIGGDKNNLQSLTFLVRLAEGQLFGANVPWSVVDNKWSHLAMTWNTTVGLSVYVDGSELREDEFVSPPVVTNVSSSYPTKVDFFAGDIMGPTFLIDDLWIFYNTLNNEDVYSLYELGAPEFEEEQQTTAAMQTTRYIEQLPPDITDSTKINNASQTTIQDTPPPQAVTTASTMFAAPSVPLVSTSRNNDIAITPRQIKVTTFGVQPVDRVTKSQRRHTTTNSPYLGWFYYQPWYYAMITTTLLIFLAVSIWLCVTYCTVEKPKKSQTDEHESQSLQLLVQKA